MCVGEGKERVLVGVWVQLGGMRLARWCQEGTSATLTSRTTLSTTQRAMCCNGCTVQIALQGTAVAYLHHVIHPVPHLRRVVRQHAQQRRLLGDDVGWGRARQSVQKCLRHEQILCPQHEVAWPTAAMRYRRQHLSARKQTGKAAARPLCPSTACAPSTNALAAGIPGLLDIGPRRLLM